MDAALLFPSKYIKSQELKGKDVTFTLTGVKLEDLERDDNTTEKRGVLAFKESEKGFILNKTNLTCIQAMFGNETDLWIGKRVTFHPIPYKNSFTGEMTTATRVRGSPDITAPVSVSIKLKKRKASVMTLKPTGNAGASVAPSNDPVEVQMDAMRHHMQALTSAASLDKAWAGGLGGQINGLPPADRDTMKKEFAALKTALIRAAKAAEKPAEEPPPPAEEAPAAA